ncbi:hypothetical protein ACFV0R_15670 [Streptomyces sp. NPDC059578]|uniref:hypothetical protein n=1 Tax=Streptomyces sp. NPDC059578 TaxID=3346874 RepID=UPI0036874864
MIALIVILAAGTVVWLVLGVVDAVQAGRPRARVTPPPIHRTPAWDEHLNTSSLPPLPRRRPLP